MVSTSRWSLVRRAFLFFTFLSPALLIYVFLMVYPMADAVRLSFFDWNGASPVMNFVGLQNYRDLMVDPIFFQALKNNIIWLVLSLIVEVIPTLILAVLISKVKWGKTFFRAGFYLPSVLALAVVAVLWSKIYDPNIGPINVFLESIGLESWIRQWLGDQFTVLPALVIVNSWAFYGLYMILFLAGLQSIDQSLYEAADIDGAGAVRKFFSITIPSLRSTMNVVISMVIIYSLKNFPIVWIMTQGGPFYKSEMVATYVYKAAFSMNKVSYATAAGVVLGLLIITITILFNYFREKE